MEDDNNDDDAEEEEEVQGTLEEAEKALSHLLHNFDKEVEPAVHEGGEEADEVKEVKEAEAAGDVSEENKEEAEEGPEEGTTPEEDEQQEVRATETPFDLEEAIEQDPSCEESYTTTNCM